MKLSTDISIIRDAVKKAGSAAGDGKTIQILGHLHFDASINGTLIIKANNLDLEISQSIVADVDEAGAVTLPAAMLGNILAKFPKDDTITIEQVKKKEAVSLRCNRSHFTLQTLPVEDFPSFPAHDSNHRFKINGTDLSRLINKTEFAIATNDNRYYLDGIYLHVAGKNLRAVTTDGHRLACVDMKLPQGAEGMPGIIVPSKTVSRLKKAIDGGAEAELSVSPNSIMLTTNGYTLKSRLIDGTFPDYSRVIPDENDKIAIVDREAFSNAVARVSAVSSERGRSVKFNFGDGTFKISVNNAGAGSAEDEFEIEYSAEPMEIGFNGDYIADILGAIDTDQVEIRLGEPGGPALLKPPGSGSESYTLMPMRV